MPPSILQLRAQLPGDNRIPSPLYHGGTVPDSTRSGSLTWRVKCPITQTIRGGRLARPPAPFGEHRQDLVSGQGFLGEEEIGALAKGFVPVLGKIVAGTTGDHRLGVDPAQLGGQVQAVAVGETDVEVSPRLPSWDSLEVYHLIANFGPVRDVSGRNGRVELGQ